MSRSTAKCPLSTGTRDGTKARGHGGSLLRRDPASAVPIVPGECPPELSRVEGLLGTDALTPWQRGFVVGCRRHVDAGRELSEKQVGVLRRLLGIASDAEHLAPARAFAEVTHG